MAQLQLINTETHANTQSEEFQDRNEKEETEFRVVWKNRNYLSHMHTTEYAQTQMSKHIIKYNISLQISPNIHEKLITEHVLINL